MFTVSKDTDGTLCVAKVISRFDELLVLSLNSLGSIHTFQPNPRIQAT